MPLLLHTQSKLTYRILGLRKSLPVLCNVRCAMPVQEAALPFWGLAVKQFSLGEMRLAAQEGQGVLVRPQTLHLSSVWALGKETLYSSGSKRQALEGGEVQS